MISFQLHLSCHTCMSVVRTDGRSLELAPSRDYQIFSDGEGGGGEPNKAKITVNDWDFGPLGNAITPLQSAIILDLT